MTWRAAVIAGGLAVLGLFALLYLVYPLAYYHVLIAWGEYPFPKPFLDAHAILSGLECTARGFDTYQLNPCDALTRAFVYSPLMLEASVLPVGGSWLYPTGIAFALVYLIAIASLPPPRAATGRVVLVLAALSTMSAFAVERGNIDLVFFAMIVLAGRLAQRGGAARAGGYAAIMLAALLKYYPIVALIVALRERPRRFFAIAAGAAALLALFVVHYRQALGEAMNRVPDGSYFTDLFGAVNLPFGLAHLLSPLADAWPASAPALRVFPWLVLAILIVSTAAQAWARLAERDAIARLPDAERLFLVLGAAVIAGCFFAGQNIGYRGIFLLLALPGLMLLGTPDSAGRRYRATAWLILFVMWGELFRKALQGIAFDDPVAAQLVQIVRTVFWLVRELAWWRIIATLAGVLVCFVASSETGAYLLARVARPRPVTR